MTRTVREALGRLVALFRKRRLDHDFDEELSTHIELLTERNQRRGLPRDEARRQALLRIGGLSTTRELHREARGLPRVETVVQASSQAWRSWRSAKTTAVVAATALAVGIGSATAIYSVVNAVMLKPLPYQDGDRFVALFAAERNDPESYSRLRSEDAQRFQEKTQAFDAFGWFREAGKNLTFAGEPHHVQGVAVTLSLVQHLGVAPVLGQWFHDESGVVISSSLWRRLGADRRIIGQGLTLDGQSYTVTGVMPEWFHLPASGMTSSGLRPDVWVALDPHERAGAAYVTYGRRRPDVTFAAAEADVKRVAAEMAAEDPVNHPAYTARLFDLRETVIRDIRPTLLLLFAAAGLLFLITCANAAGLLLVRSVARARETALRVALGAGRAQLGVHYFAEGLLISLAGAAGGVLLGVTLTPVVVSMAADYLPRAEEIRVDWTVLLFALGAAFLASLLSSLAPFWQATRTAPSDVLRDGVRASAGARSRRASQSLVVAEIALAFALLAVSSVLIGHLRYLSRISPGFDTDQVLTFELSVPGPFAEDTDGRRAVQIGRLIDAINAIPGVEEVAFANRLPLKGFRWPTMIHPDGRPEERSASQNTSLMAVSSGYFRAMRIPLRGGRFLTESDGVQNPASIPIVISQAAARRYWGDENPVGRSGWFDDEEQTRFHVVGIAGDVKNDGLSNPTIPEVYMPAVYAMAETLHFVARSARPAVSLVPDIRRAVQRIDPEQPIHGLATMGDVVRDTITLERAASFLTGFFASAALLMAMLGVYGVVAYSVRQRNVEIGIRMALGATSRGVLASIVGAGLKMAAYGVMAGAIAAIGAASYLGRVFQVGEIGPAPFLYSTAIVAIVALAASFLPAWRAALSSPLVAIRNESQ